jgi:hypothetical protein
MLEVWVPIKGYEGHYSVSSLGRVKSLKRFKKCGLKVVPVPERVLKNIQTEYISVSLWKEGKLKVKTLHRLIAEAFIPNENNKIEVNHIDGNKKNNAITNLEWATRKENQRHALDIGLMPRGEAHVNHKLSYEDVIFIHENRNMTQKAVAAMFKVSQRLICKTLKNTERIEHAYKKTLAL